MSVLAIILIVFAVLVIVLATLGAFVAKRRRGEGEDKFHAQLAMANEALADARATDRGWDPDSLEAVARAAVERKHPNATVRGVHLVQVVDRPGTDDDEAHFHVDIVRGRDFTVVLGREGGEWKERSEAR